MLPGSYIAEKIIIPLVFLLLLLLPGFIPGVVADEQLESKTVHRLKAMSRDKRDRLDAFTHEIRQRSLGQVTDLIQIWMTGDTNMVWKSAYILARLGSVVIDPLLETGTPRDPQRHAWRMKRLTRLQLERRDAIIDEFFKQLDNQTLIPSPVVTTHVEDPVVDQRICDLAYLQLRRLLNTAETLDEQLETAHIYNRLEPEQRDQMINAFKKQGVWMNLIEGEFLESGDDDVRHAPVPLK
jgi:hypothetical protein